MTGLGCVRVGEGGDVRGVVGVEVVGQGEGPGHVHVKGTHTTHERSRRTTTPRHQRGQRETIKETKSGLTVSMSTKLGACCVCMGLICVGVPCVGVVFV